MGAQNPPPCVVRLDDVETLDSAASDRLLALAREAATGELTCYCASGRMQLYLQRGRVAWASDPRHQRAFTAHLKEHARVRAEDIEAVVDSCRATGRPIGETLIERGLATEAQVRAALRHQIGLALHIGRCASKGELAFAPRNYADYDPRFTFGASELIDEEERTARANPTPAPRREPPGR
ncbi:DUF4388 domain-containing protein [Anaeromyxobacter diazotrophicus]|uniref:PatA-like N-terminal domain-containing protein n=1 Tax=Anaeromyxobacter diazotrophicus TaxID=2590199 RepID=A0A7I9VPM7_9BACT|nr:DUF4388 domain-containing protein [Anaeromyxobacter diazotrophicus]GEJ57917.1 hypothetical protein AMYX_26580 [Anaeromyxobacter diazotrophicus]